MQRRERTITLIADVTAAGAHEINAAAAGAVGRPRRKLNERRGTFALGKSTERLLPRSRRARKRKPVVVLRIEHDGIAIARFWVIHPPAVDVLPDRLISVAVAAALDVAVAAEDAALERAEFFQLFGAGGDLRGREVAVAAGAAELEHRGHRAALGGLRAISGALGEIAERARRHLAVAIEIHRAFELKAERIEIVPMARRGEVAVLLADTEVKISRGSRLALEEMPVVERAAAMLQAALPFDLIAVNDFHEFITPRAGRSSLI